MVKRHHLISGLGNGDVHKHEDAYHLAEDDFLMRRHIRGKRKSPPLKFSLEEVYPVGVQIKSAHKEDQVSTPRHYYIMAFIALIGLLVALFLHLVTENDQSLRKGRKRLKKKKTDDWSDDYETEDYVGDHEGVAGTSDGYYYPKGPKHLKYRKSIAKDNQQNRIIFHNTAPSSYRSSSNSYYTQHDASPQPAMKVPVAAAALSEILPDHPLKAQRLSPASSFASMPPGYQSDSSANLPRPPGVTSGYQSDSSSNFPMPSPSQSSRMQVSPALSFRDMETPKMGTKRIIDGGELTPSMELPPTRGSPAPKKNQLLIPFMPNLDVKGSRNLMAAPQPISVEELQSEMESGNLHNQSAFAVNDPMLSFARSPEEKAPSFAIPPVVGDTVEPSEDESLDENDPRKNIVHKRKNLTFSTDTTTSLLGTIRFEELSLQEVIGGGGFGQVWRATWRSTPVAVKVLTGSAQRVNVSRIILEEFAAEINMLKGMRHPNICLYMGACLDPPNRAIVTELAANGSLWDALRLPLQAPFVHCDGKTRTGWPSDLYIENGSPPTPPRGTWPWTLVKRVASGAARGMTYLHSGSPPVLHRDLKSANLLLDDSYTTKVCDFGLSRLKAQERSMTGNCGTVQWMAPEILANQPYAEPADVFSFGIILWELLTAECPYDGMSAIQCALAVLNRDQRPQIPEWCPPTFSSLIKSCVKRDPGKRPTFSQVCEALEKMP
mmetsp:Transcript_17740/g.26870  ORF Transcript_17740/g.26870 Transcript_17740/m.26870 type:complete len:719 (-) Transcript_17740:1887-4043(-)